IVDQMPRGLHAADGGERLAFAPGVEFLNFFAAFKPVVAHRHHAIRCIKFMRAASTIMVNLVPILRLQVIKRVPKADLVARIHPLPPAAVAAPPNPSSPPRSLR